MPARLCQFRQGLDCGGKVGVVVIIRYCEAEPPAARLFKESSDA